MHYRLLVLPLLVVSLFLCLTPLLAQDTAEAYGIVFRTLSKDDLDGIERGLGRRTGVEVIEVKPGGAGAAAGMKPGVMMNVGASVILTAQEAAKALKAAQGEVQVIVMTQKGDEDWEPIQYTLKLEGAADGGQVAPQPVQDGMAAVTDDPITCYFDLMDFIRSQAWNRQIVTPPQERQRVAMLVQQFANEMSQQDQMQLMAVPQAWAMVQQNWKKANETERGRQRAQWREQILLPTNLLPPPANLQSFAAEGNLVAFEYPAEWTGGLQEIEGINFMFIGPNGSQAQWEQVLDTPQSPSGALFALFQMTPEMQQLPDWVAGARYLAQQLMPQGLQSFKETSVLPIGEEGAVITIQGKFPGQNEEKFYWIGVAKFGSDKIFAGRLGGKVGEADELLPGFRHMLATLKLNPPRPAGGLAGAGGSWEAAWSRVDVAITKNIWAPSGN